MLKHASSAGGPANGQLRNSTPAAAAATVAGRSIHLRPQQPLNISTLSTASLQSTVQSAANTTTLNGGQRIPVQLNIAAPQPLPPPGATLTAASTAPLASTTSLAPNCFATSNNNLHTYTNQHAIAAAAAASANANTPNVAANSNHNHSINHNYSNCNNLTGVLVNPSKHGPGPREALTSLGLLCLVSLLLALLSLIFLLKISPNAREDALSRSASEDFVIVYDVTLALCALSLSLNLCCLLVCAIQFLFAVKLVRSPMFNGRDNKYLEKSSLSRSCAVGGFFISIPIFLTGIILYTFNHFHSTPAIITSVLIGIGIVFCGGAMVHNVFIWQKEKTISYRSPPINLSMISHIGPITPPPQFLNHHSHHQLLNSTVNNFNQSHASVANSYHPTSVTPVSPNHSHGSFNPLPAGVLSSSFLIRPATATPPTPKPIGSGGACQALNVGREASGSVSPGMPAALDMSNITNASLHELSTLV